jgi:sulfur carrier protein ThiS
MNIGGDVLVQGDEVEIVQIVDPKADAINDPAIDKVNLQNQFIATSGNYRRGVLINNQWYSHIIDPRSGQPAGQVISASVISKNPVDAGALATAFNILSVNESIALAQKFPDAEYFIVAKNGDMIKSAHWKDIEVTAPKPAKNIAFPVKENQWDPTYEMLINLDLAQFQGPSRRPFVAIWVEDKAPVRNLALWYNKPRWLHDLRAWYNANYGKYNVETGSISALSSATRSPGKYTIKWDGKDDKGEYVKTGNYTINIEVVREHGTYQLITQEIKINNKVNKIELTANTEVAAASIELKKKSDE